MDKPAILVFGLGILQQSLIEQCKSLGFYTVGIDVTSDPVCKDNVDAFEIAAGDDYETTLDVAKKYHVCGVITAATDKPLVMMARIAEAMNLPFYSIQTAKWSTDKLQMKQRFQKYDIPCAKGIEIKSIDELKMINMNYPLIVKPRDNSGSRGVIFCENEKETSRALSEAFGYTHKDTVLIEEYIEGQEYSVESMHYKGKTYVVQLTQKITTEFPYNVELGHLQPVNLNEKEKEKIRLIINKIAEALEFDNCASHTEIKIGKTGITVIETSPRLGGDYITSLLTPLSTGVNLEKLLVKMSSGGTILDSEFIPKRQNSSGVIFFELPEGEISKIGDLEMIGNIPGCVSYEFNKQVGDIIHKITNSIDRYGYALFDTKSRDCTKFSMDMAKDVIRNIVEIKQ